MKINYLLGHASGLNQQDCHFIALRFDERWGFKPDVGDSSVMQRHEGSLYHRLHARGWFTSLWRSPAGCVYVSDIASRVHVNTDLRPGVAPWRMDTLPGALSGVWGVDDSCVFVWGSRGQDNVMYQWNGTTWNNIDSPGRVVGMGGLTPDLAYAVGNDGLIARWDGKRWTSVPSPTRSVLSAVFVASADEMYAVGAGRRLLEGSVHGWTEVCEGPSPMFGVAKFRGEVWVGASDAGLMKRDGNTLVAVKPNILADRLEVHDTLLISSPGMIVGTPDGNNFLAIKAASVIENVSQTPPAWVK